jgi:hypothetical protein
MMNILIQYPHVIVMVLWFAIVACAILRYANYIFFTKVSWRALVTVAVSVHFGYGVLLTWGQYVQWGSDSVTKVFLEQPLPKVVPLTPFLEWLRPAFEQQLGYFMFYVFGHFWVNIILVLGLAGAFAMLLKLRAYYRPTNFKEGEIAMITLALLVAGWPGIIVAVPLAFIFAIVSSIFSSVFFNVSRIHLAPAFLVAAPVALISGITILKFAGLYTLLKL